MKIRDVGAAVNGRYAPANVPRLTIAGLILNVVINAELFLITGDCSYDNFIKEA